jgi:tetratricopeptide (TPR) repeat protein
LETKGKTQDERVVTFGVMAMRGLRVLAAWVLGVVLAGGAGCWGQATMTDRERAANEIRHAKVTALMDDARTLYDAAQYREAADLLRQATIIDPQDEDAAFMLRLVMVKIMDRDSDPAWPAAKVNELMAEARKSYDARQFKQAKELLGRASELDPRNADLAAFKVLISEELNSAYQKAGPTLAISGGASDIGTLLPEKPFDGAVRDRLEENLKEITADAQGLEKVINFLRDNMGANVFVNWPALAAVNVDRQTLVTVSIKDVPFRKALTTILQQVGGPGVELSYRIDDGIIVISTKEELTASKYQVVTVFDVHDLLPLAPPAVPGEAAPATIADMGKLREERVRALMEEITKTVAPETWKNAGGTIGSIRELKGMLVVNQLPENQREIHQLLETMRKKQGQQMTLDAGVSLVSVTFVEDFGFGWKLESVDPPGEGPRRVHHFSATLIDQWTHSLLVTTTSADRRTAMVTAPQATVNNGWKAAITNGRGKRCVSGYIHATSPMVPVEYVPVYVDAGAGLSLVVTPTAALDRRSVVMEVDVTRKVVTKMERAEAPDVPKEKGLKIDKPVLATVEGKFIVEVPEGATLLIDGGRVPGDFLRGAGDQGEREMLILLRPSLVRREVDATRPGTASAPATGKGK